jgi:hypothetical protein
VTGDEFCDSLQWPITLLHFTWSELRNLLRAFGFNFAPWRELFSRKGAKSELKAQRVAGLSVVLK